MLNIGQISIFFNSGQIVPQREALERIVSKKKLAWGKSRSQKVETCEKKIEKGQILDFIKRRHTKHQNEALDHS